MRILPLLVFWCLWFLNFSTRTAFSPILPLIEDTLSLSHGESGGLFTSLSIGYGISVFSAGRFASAWGHKKMVAAGFLFTGLAFVAFQWAESYLAFQVLFFFLGLASGPYLPAILPIITEMYEYRYWGKAIGFHDSAAGFSTFLLPILAVFALGFLSWRAFLLVLASGCFLLPVLFWKVSIEPKKEGPQARVRLADLLKKKSIWILAILWIFSAGSSLGIYSILPLYLVKERGIDFYFANTLFGISRAGGAIVQILIGFLIDRYGYTRILKVTVLATGLATVALSFSSTLTEISIALILQATLSVSFFPVGLAAISKVTSVSERAMAVGFVGSVGTVFGSGIVPLLLGVVADNFSFMIGILGLGILTSLSAFAVKLLKV